MTFGPRSTPEGAPPEDEFYACPGCAKTFATKRELKAHIKDEH